MNTKIIRLMGIIFIMILLICPDWVTPKNRCILVNGGGTPSGNQAKDKIIDDALAKMRQIMETWHDPDMIHEVDRKDSLIAKLQSMKGKVACGDTLTLVLVGHGSNETFSFTPSKENMTADELLKYFKEIVDTVCCCKINVIIDACFSGSFREKLFQDKHVVSVQASTDVDEWSWDFKSKYRWINLFNDDLQQASDDSLNLGDALNAGAKSARDSIPEDIKPFQHPIGWCRGKHQALAHIDMPPDTSQGKALVTLYEPYFARNCSRLVDIPDPQEQLEHCHWITFTADFGGPDDDMTYAGELKLVAPPTETIIAHVEGVDREKNKLKVKVIQPSWIGNNLDSLHVKPPAKIAADVDSCRWIKQEVTIDDPSYGGYMTTSSSVIIYDYTFRATGHIDWVDTTVTWGRWVKIRFTRPPWLATQIRYVWFPSNYTSNITLNPCKSIIFPLKPDNRNFDATGPADKISANQASVKPQPVQPSTPKPIPKPTPEEEEREEEEQPSKFFLGFAAKPEYAFWNLNDFQKSKETYERYDEEEGSTASAETFSGSMGYIAEIMGGFHLASGHIIGLSTGYGPHPGGTFSQRYHDNTGYTSTVGLDLSVHTIPVEIFYKMKLNHAALFLDLSAGIDFYRATVDYNWNYGTAGSLKGNMKDSGMGFHFSIGSEFFFRKNMALFVQAGYGFATLNHFTGILTDQDGHQTDMHLIMIDESKYGESLWVAPVPVNAFYEPDTRPAEIDFNGLRFSVGIQLFLNSP
ncbi:hypothetical protein JW824_15165 [bacterium]|nr:hypothetical protein [bacterium]